MGPNLGDVSRRAFVGRSWIRLLLQVIMRHIMRFSSLIPGLAITNLRLDCSAFRESVDTAGAATLAYFMQITMDLPIAVLTAPVWYGARA